MNMNETATREEGAPLKRNLLLVAGYLAVLILIAGAYI